MLYLSLPRTRYSGKQEKDEATFISLQKSALQGVPCFTDGLFIS